MKRVLALYLPLLPIDRRSKPADAAVVTIAPQGQLLRVIRANTVAQQEGVRRGQTLADAKAVAPQLVTLDDDPAGDRRQLETIAIGAQRLSPIVHIEDESTLLVDVTGCDRLFGGEQTLLNQAIDWLQGEGFAVRGAIADTPGASWALAHSHPDASVIAEPGQTAAFLTPLPVWSLRIDAKTVASLASVGVEEVSYLWHLPRSSLARRFGEAVLRRMDQALGDQPELLTPYRPQPMLASRLTLGHPTTRIEALTEAIKQTVNSFCKKLTGRAAGVRQAFLTVTCPDVVTDDGTQTRRVTIHVDLSQPTRSAGHLFSLLRVLLDNLSLPGPADHLTLWARELDPLDDRQEELFATAAGNARELGCLLDRLAVRLGQEAVVRPVPVSDHQPERAFRYAPTSGDQAKNSKPTADADNHPPGPRPLTLLPRPIAIAVTALVPEGPPISYRADGTHHVVFGFVGPERIETGWWRGAHIQRDYYRVATSAGRRSWIFRDRPTGRWFLHGWFD